MPNVSLICTVYNEEKTISPFLESVAAQTRIPNEIIIVDGGSIDGTFETLKKAKKKYPHLNLKVFREKSNRSKGRNVAITKAKYQVIAITDAGCILDALWLESLVKLYMQTNVDIVSGYYRAEPQTAFEAAVVPFVLVMPDAVDPLSFLPATRSVLLRSAVFKKVGLFDESLELSEDFVFFKKARQLGCTFAFAKDATVVWIPRTSLQSFFRMVRGMAESDVLGGVLRTKAILVVARYLFFIGLFVGGLFLAASFWVVLILLLAAYSLWAVMKNSRYVAPRSYLWLLVLQYTADYAVIVGTLGGYVRKARVSL